MKIIEEETAKRVEEAITKRVEEILNIEEIKVEIQRRLEEGRIRLHEEVAAQLEKYKAAALLEGRRKEACTQLLASWFLLNFHGSCRLKGTTSFIP